MYPPSKRSSDFDKGDDFMKLFKKLKTYFISYAISYTLASLMLSLTSLYANINTSANVWLLNAELNLVCFIISTLMLLTDWIADPSGDCRITPLSSILGFFDVALPVLCLGGSVFGWFDLLSGEILYPLCIITAVYLATLLLFIINGKLTEKAINRRINERKEMMKNEQNNRG